MCSWAPICQKLQLQRVFSLGSRNYLEKNKKITEFCHKPRISRTFAILLIQFRLIFWGSTVYGTRSCLETWCFSRCDSPFIGPNPGELPHAIFLLAPLISTRHHSTHSAHSITLLKLCGGVKMTVSPFRPLGTYI